jgi:L-fuconolactonase
MIIDSHQHFWKYDAARHAWITDAMSAVQRDFMPEEFARERKANGVDGSIVVQVDQTEEETQFLLDLAESDESIVGVVGWVDLRSPSVEERMQYFTQFKKLCGFRHIVEVEPNDFLVDPDFARGISRLKEFNFAYEILIYPKQLPAAIDLVARFPEQKFIVDHAAKPLIKAGALEPWAAYMKTIAQNPNVHCKVSGLVTEADWTAWKPEDFRPYLDVVFDAFGPERLMFGSDWPVCLLAASYKQVKELVEAYVDKNASAHKEQIFSGNALRFYGLLASAHGSAA